MMQYDRRRGGGDRDGSSHGKKRPDPGKLFKHNARRTAGASRLDTFESAVHGALSKNTAPDLKTIATAFTALASGTSGDRDLYTALLPAFRQGDLVPAQARLRSLESGLASPGSEDSAWNLLTNLGERAEGTNFPSLLQLSREILARLGRRAEQPLSGSNLDQLLTDTLNDLQQLGRVLPWVAEKKKSAAAIDHSVDAALQRLHHAVLAASTELFNAGAAGELTGLGHRLESFADRAKVLLKEVNASVAPGTPSSGNGSGNSLAGSDQSLLLLRGHAVSARNIAAYFAMLEPENYPPARVDEHFAQRIAAVVEFLDTPKGHALAKIPEDVRGTLETLVVMFQQRGEFAARAFGRAFDTFRQVLPQPREFGPAVLAFRTLDLLSYYDQSQPAMRELLLSAHSQCVLHLLSAVLSEAGPELRARLHENEGGEALALLRLGVVQSHSFFRYAGIAGTDLKGAYLECRDVLVKEVSDLAAEGDTPRIREIVDVLENAHAFFQSDRLIAERDVTRERISRVLVDAAHAQAEAMQRALTDDWAPAQFGSSFRRGTELAECIPIEEQKGPVVRALQAAVFQFRQQLYVIAPDEVINPLKALIKEARAFRDKARRGEANGHPETFESDLARTQRIIEILAEYRSWQRALVGESSNGDASLRTLSRDAVDSVERPLGALLGLHPPLARALVEDVMNRAARADRSLAQIERSHRITKQEEAFIRKSVAVMVPEARVRIDILSSLDERLKPRERENLARASEMIRGCAARAVRLGISVVTPSSESPGGM